MRVICPNCNLDAGNIPEVTVGRNLECECGHKWTYEGEPKNIPPVPNHNSGATDKPAGNIASSMAKASGSLIALGFKKAQKHVSKKAYQKKFPQVFLDAASDGVITQEEEMSIRSQLAKHGLSWQKAIADIKPMTVEFGQRVFKDMIADGVITKQEQDELTRYIDLFDLRKEMKPLARKFIRRVLAETISDSKVTEDEREKLNEYLDFFGLPDLRNEVEDVLDRVETIWKLNNNMMPDPLPDKPIWLHSGEALYMKTDAVYLRQLKSGIKEIDGELFITNSRFEFISQDFTFSHAHDQLRRSEPTRRTHLTLLFHPKSGSGTYQVQDAPLVCAYLNCLARVANRTVSIVSEDSSIKDRRTIPKEVRHAVWVRDGGKCLECEAEDYLEFDHIIPVSRGGANTVTNIQLLCRRCNGKKSNKI